eukprot:253849_1
MSSNSKWSRQKAFGAKSNTNIPINRQKYSQQRFGQEQKTNLNDIADAPPFQYTQIMAGVLWIGKILHTEVILTKMFIFGAGGAIEFIIAPIIQFCCDGRVVFVFFIMSLILTYIFSIGIVLLFALMALLFVIIVIIVLLVIWIMRRRLIPKLHILAIHGGYAFFVVSNEKIQRYIASVKKHNKAYGVTIKTNINIDHINSAADEKKKKKKYFCS